MIKFSILYKLLGSFIFIALLTLSVSLYTLKDTDYLKRNFTTLVEYNLPRLQALLEMRNTALKINLFISDFENELKTSQVNANTPTQIGAAKDALLAYLGDIEMWQKAYQTYSLPDKSASINMKELSQLRDNEVLIALSIFSGEESGQQAALLAEKRSQLEVAQNKLSDYIKSAAQIETTLLEEQKDKMLTESEKIYHVAIVINMIIILTAVALSLFLARLISWPIIQLKKFTSNVDQENLDQQCPIRTNDEVGDLVISINGMLGALSQAKTNLIESSRLAGITEITTSILHNVGNVLNSINVSAMAIHEEVDRSRLLKLKQVYEMLDVNKQDLNYLNTNDQGKILLPYLDALISHLQAEQGKIKNELSRLINNLNHVNNIIALQQSSVKQHAVEERIVMSQLLEDVLTMFSAKIKTSNINIERSYADIPAIKSVKAKIHQIMANLIKNAIESLSEVGHTDRLLIIKMAEVDENFIQVSISDNGIGISAENLTSIFSFGFTTKSQGHGYGLHNCALLAKELGGKLLAESKGIDLGAAFILEIPIIHPKKTVPISLTLKQPDSKAPVTP